jgi:hypothetical protein
VWTPISSPGHDSPPSLRPGLWHRWCVTFTKPQNKKSDRYGETLSHIHMKNSSSWGHIYRCTNMRYIIWMMVLSAKKKGPCTFVCERRWLSSGKCDFNTITWNLATVIQTHTFFTVTQIWKTSSLTKMRYASRSTSSSSSRAIPSQMAALFISALSETICSF